MQNDAFVQEIEEISKSATDNGCVHELPFHVVYVVNEFPFGPSLPEVSRQYDGLVHEMALEAGFLIGSLEVRDHEPPFHPIKPPLLETAMQNDELEQATSTSD